MDNQSVDVFATPIMPARAVEHARAFLSYPAGVWMTGPHPARLEPIGVLGQACASASDKAACDQVVAMLSAPDAACAEDAQCKPFVLTTQGDEVRRFDREQDLLEWLGNIDTPSEAVLVATFKGLRPACDRVSGSGPLGTSRGTMVRDQPDGYSVRSEWQECGSPEQRETIEVARDGSTGELARMESAPTNCTVGRRPAGLQPTAAAVCERFAVAEYLAAAVTLEAASVYAFRQLARELTEHGAPAELIAWATRAALEEVRHTQLMAAEAERYGATPVAPHVVPVAARTLFDIALENAVEGCVRETFGALVAHQQAAVAHDPNLARVMSTIARDEASHAELAWRINAWVEPRLEASERAQLASARREALAALHRAADADTMPESAAHVVGLPSSALQHATLDQLRASFALA